MKKVLYGIVAAWMGLVGTEAAAQLPIPVGVEGRVGMGFPTGEFGQMTNSGVGFGLAVTAQLMPNYGFYLGYSRTEFGLEGDADASVVDFGFSVGLTAAYPLFGTAIMPWLGTGLLFHDLEVRGTETVPEATSPGWEVGGGLAIALTPRIRITPGIGFRTYRASLLEEPEVGISYVTAGVGVNIGF